MTPLDPPAAAARRQYVLDRLVELLVGWGCPLEHAEPRARELLHTVTDAGYALPAAVDDRPTTRGTSTVEGRVRALTAFTHRRDPVDYRDGVSAAARCRCGWRGPFRPWAQVLTVAADHSEHVEAQVRASLGAHNAGAVAGVGAPNGGGAVPQDPPNAPAGADGVELCLDVWTTRDTSHTCERERKHPGQHVSAPGTLASYTWPRS